MPSPQSRVLVLDTIDELSRQGGFVHRLDTRVMLLTTLAYLATVVSFERHAVLGLLSLLAFPIVEPLLAGIPARFLLMRLLWVAPFAVMVGALEPVLDPVRYTILPGLTIRSGWLTLLSLVLRVALTVSSTLILVATVGMPRLASAFGRLGAPRVFVVQLLLLYRYLWVLADETGRIHRAREARSAGRPQGLATYGSLLGHLLLRTWDRAQSIHDAMVARGFAGHIRVRDDSHLDARSVGFLLGWLFFFVMARHSNAVSALGAFIVGSAP